MKVLVVDDEESICVLVRRILELAGIKCSEQEFVCLGTLSEALAKCAEMLPDIVILDWKLKDSGRENTVGVGVGKFAAMSPVVCLTGTSFDQDSELFQKAILNGASNVLYKPDITRNGNEGSLAKAIAVAQLVYQRGR